VKRKKWTPEEWREWRAKGEATQRLLQEHIERIRAELEAKKRPA
jgi:hypothetical protein